MSETEIIPISKLLPRGTLLAFAKKYGLSWPTLKNIAEGISDHPIIYAELLKVAETEKQLRREKERLRKTNREKAKKFTL